MTVARYIPTLRGWLALAVGIADGAIVPLLIPAYDGPPTTVFHWAIAALLAFLTGALSFRSFRSARLSDRLAAVLTTGFAAWIFYVFLRTVV